MFADISKPPAPLPTARPQDVGTGLCLLPPMSRRGHGPGMIILVADAESSLKIDHGVPGTLLKWAEEGYAVVEISASTLAGNNGALKEAIEALKSCKECDWDGKAGIIAYDLDAWTQVVSLLPDTPEIVGAVVYTDTEDRDVSPIPTLFHIAGSSSTPPRRTDAVTEYYYPDVKSRKFAMPFHDDFHYRTEAVSHTRNLTFLKPRIGGPYFDLETIWDEHTYYEFADRSVEHTMSTMVQEPYVNHVPTMTGGIGRENLSKFYAGHFIFNNSADTEMELMSRTIGIDRVVDEFIYKFTHDKELDWLVPGIPPTNLKVEVPFTAVVNIRGDRLYHEHIAWDQCTVLRQLGLMPEYLPFPYPLPDGQPGAKAEYRVPTAGIDVARKMREKNSVTSNEMFDFKVRTSE